MLWFVGALVILLASSTSPPNFSDEGYLLAGIHRIQDGQLPGADFHAYMPLRYFIGAWCSRTSPTRLIDLRRIEAGLIIASLLLMAVAGARPRSEKWFVGSLIIVPTLFFPGPWHKSLELLATMLVAFAVSHRPRAGRHLRWMIMAGVACGVAVISRVELGAVLTLITVVAAARVNPRSLGFAALGFVAPLTLASLPYLVSGRAGEAARFYSQEFIDGLTGLGAGVNPFLSGPGTSGSEVASEVLFLLAVGSVLTVLLISIVLGIRSGALLWGWGPLAAIATARLAPLMHSFDASHLLQALPAVYLPAVGIRHKVVRVTSLAVLAAVHFGVASSVGDHYYRGNWRSEEPTTQIVIDDLLRGIEMPEGRSELVFGLRDLLNTHARPDRSMIAVPYSPMLVTLVGGHNTTRSDYYFPATRQSAHLTALLGRPEDRPAWILTDMATVDEGEHLWFRGDTVGLSAAVEKNYRRVGTVQNWALWSASAQAGST